MAFAIASANVPAFAQPRRPQPAAPKKPESPPGPKPLAETLTGDAKADYELGNRLVAAGDFEKARLKFQSAYDKEKDPRLLMSMAGCEQRQKHYVKAVALMQRFLDEGGAVSTEESRAFAKNFVKEASGLIVKVTIKVNEPNASVMIDDEKAGLTPLPDGVPLDIGEHRFRVTKEGFRDVVKRTTLTGPAEATLDFKLEKDIHEGRVAIRAGAQDQISVDGAVVGVGKWEGVLPSGGHSVVISAPGFRRYQGEIVVQDGKTRSVEITLEREHKASVIPTWAWIAGGGLLVTGAAIGGYFLFKPGEEQAKPVEGTLTPGTVQLPGFGGIRFQ